MYPPEGKVPLCTCVHSGPLIPKFREAKRSQGRPGRLRAFRPNHAFAKNPHGEWLGGMRG